MKLKVGDCIRVKTKVALKDEEVFGVVIYKLVEIGVHNPHTSDSKVKNGLKFEMLGGSGPSALAGMRIVDDPGNVERDMKKGTTELIPEDQALKIAKGYNARNKNQLPGGGIEI